MAYGTVPAIVIDNGSCTSNVGYAGDDDPRIIFPSIVGHPKRHDASAGKRSLQCYIGDDAEVKRSDLDFIHPIENGIVTNWDDMEKIWHHILNNEFCADTKKESPIMLTEVAMNPKPNREKTTEIMFQTFTVPALYMATQEVLALFASGRTTGIVFGSGDGVSHAVPIYEGYTLPFVTLRLELAGSHVTEYLGSLLMGRGDPYTTTSELETARKIKEKLCYVAADFEHELSIADSNTTINQSYELPDGRCVDVGSERFRAPECLFKPSLIGKPDTPGIHEITFNAIRKCDVELRADLHRNIVLCGGSTLFSGIEERMKKEITSLAHPCNKVKVIAPPERKLAAWKGGSILGSLSTFQEMCFSKEEYDENGPAIVHRKWFQ